MVAQEFFGPCLDVQNVVKCKERIFAMQIGAILIDALLVRRYSRDQYFNFFPAPSFTATTIMSLNTQTGMARSRIILCPHATISAAAQPGGPTGAQPPGHPLVPTSQA